MKTALLNIIVLFALLMAACQSKQEAQSNAEQVAAYFESIKQDSAALHTFFAQMPKGGDIHHHASGTPYAEAYIATAQANNLNIFTQGWALTANAPIADSIDAVNTLLGQQPQYKDTLIDYWSIRNYQKYGRDGNEWFFNTFLKFDLAFDGHEAQHLSQMCQKASQDNIQYLETIIWVRPVQAALGSMVGATGINYAVGSVPNVNYDSLFTAWYATLEANGLEALAQANADSLESYYNNTQRHGVDLRFQTYGLRLLPNQLLTFAQVALGFKTAGYTNKLVGVNFVAREDNAIAIAAYDLHMHMFRFLKAKMPQVNVSLHAGELSDAFMAQNPTYDKHILKALNIAGAQRIGHGFDIKKEANPDSVLALLKQHNALVEINLRSNEVILEATPATHPVGYYIEQGIPIAIATDDEGVLRTNLIEQYVLLVQFVPGITYAQVKQIVLNSIEYAFLPPAQKEALLASIQEKFKAFEAGVAPNKA